MTQYAILDRPAWDGHTEQLQDCPGVTIVGIENLGRAVQERTGRAHVLAIGSCTRKLCAGQRLFIAAPFRRGGVLVQKVT